VAVAKGKPKFGTRRRTAAVRLTAAKLKILMPLCPDPKLWVRPLNAAMARFAIDTPARAAAFLAQAAHESGQLRWLVERLGYSAPRLMAVWPRRFPTLGVAQEYANAPERLANFVYANRLGNGDVASGDGWRYRGRGIFQITGRGNYRRIGEALGLPLEDEPARVEQPEVAALTAAQFWQSRGLNELADDRSDDNDGADFETICVLVNGGREGLASRRAYWDAARALFA
jgi:putative chitinase